jgi:hypothetical protein
MRKLTRYIPEQSVLWSLLFFSLGLQAKTLNVQCSSGSRNDPTTISAALKLLDPSVPNTLNISGACHENVVINSFDRLTLMGKPGASVTDASGGTAQTILVVDSNDVVFRRLTIDGGLVGVQCDDFSTCRFIDDTIANGGGGIQITESRAELAGTTIRHTENGLTSLGASSVRIVGGVTIENNGTGIVVDGDSSLEAIAATIRNNQLPGIEVAEHAYLSLSATTITGNRNGIEVVHHSDVHLAGGGNSITGNRDYGIFLFDLSFATFDPGNNITGNNTNGGNALDVACFRQYTATRGALANIGGGATNCVEP